MKKSLAIALLLPLSASADVQLLSSSLGSDGRALDLWQLSCSPITLQSGEVIKTTGAYLMVNDDVTHNATPTIMAGLSKDVYNDIGYDATDNGSPNVTNIAVVDGGDGLYSIVVKKGGNAGSPNVTEGYTVQAYCYGYDATNALQFTDAASIQLKDQ